MASLQFPQKTLDLMKKISVSENDVSDAYNTGEHFPTSTGSHIAVRKYPSYGYELSILYVLDNFSGRSVVTYVRKRPIL